MVRRTGFLPGLTRTNTGSVRVRSGVGSGCGVAIFDADAPSVRGLVWVAVMGVCLWFENPIACLFELVVMPEIVCFSGETIYWASFDHPRGRVGCLAGIHSARSEEHTSELQSRGHLVCRLLMEKKKTKKN